MSERKSVMVGARISGETKDLFDACLAYLNQRKRDAGLIAETTQSEVIKFALLCMDEKHGITKKKSPPKRAV